GKDWTAPAAAFLAGDCVALPSTTRAGRSGGRMMVSPFPVGRGGSAVRSMGRSNVHAPYAAPASTAMPAAERSLERRARTRRDGAPATQRPESALMKSATVG